MYLRFITISAYLMFMYWISSYFPTMKMAFYPTLAAFGFLFVHRMDRFSELWKMTMGAVAAAFIGSCLFAFSSGIGAFFVTALVTISIIHLFKLNAAPVLAVSLIPFFTHPDVMWALPVAVLATLCGLLLTLWIVGHAEKSLQNFSFIPELRNLLVSSKQKVIMVPKD